MQDFTDETDRAVPWISLRLSPGATSDTFTLRHLATGRTDHLRVYLPPDAVGKVEADARLEGDTLWTRVDTAPGLTVTATAGERVGVEVRYRGIARGDIVNIRVPVSTVVATEDSWI